MTRVMKDSGVDWIGKIPQGWDITKIKNYCKTVFSGGTPDTTRPEYWEGEISWLPSGELQNCTITQPVRFITNEGLVNSSTKMIPANTTLIAMTGATCGNVGYLTFDSCANQSVTAYIAKDKTYSKFLYYLLQSAREEILLNKTGGAQGGINVSNCKNISVPFLSYVVQQAIADYLDKKCGEIDKVVETEKAVIEKLKEYKQSIITEAVTKGLDKSVTLKDSGIEWIGKIPAHWESMKLKFCTYIRARLGWKGLKAEEYVEEGYPFLSAFNIVNSKLVFEDLNFINQFRYDESPEIKLQESDVLLVKDGAGIGKCAIVENMPKPSTVNGSIAVITTNNLLKGKFLYYYFLSNLFQAYIDRLKDGMGVPHLFQSDLREITIVMPKSEEQQQIADYLDKKCSEIDQAIAHKEQVIEKFTEYKKSLIYECVTGKKEVA
ncbi:MAG: restriction endonuclease subunit S [Alphaproteobacteria bacterium]|nr:restriction endonuclease subunit S [Alphaproteobacteria bacterium]